MGELWRGGCYHCGSWLRNYTYESFRKLMRSTSFREAMKKTGGLYSCAKCGKPWKSGQFINPEQEDSATETKVDNSST